MAGSARLIFEKTGLHLRIPNLLNRLSEILTQTPSITHTVQVAAQVNAQDVRLRMLIDFYSMPKSRDEMQVYKGIDHREYFRKAFLKPLLESGKLQMTIPDKPNSRNQKYVRVPVTAPT